MRVSKEHPAAPPSAETTLRLIGQTARSPSPRQTRRGHQIACRSPTEHFAPATMYAVTVLVDPSVLRGRQWPRDADRRRSSLRRAWPRGGLPSAEPNALAIPQPLVLVHSACRISPVTLLRSCEFRRTGYFFPVSRCNTSTHIIVRRCGTVLPRMTAGRRGSGNAPAARHLPCHRRARGPAGASSPPCTPSYQSRHHSSPDIRTPAAARRAPARAFMSLLA